MLISDRLRKFIEDHKHVVDYDVWEDIENCETYEGKISVLTEFILEVSQQYEYGHISPDEFVLRNTSDSDAAEEDNPFFQEYDETSDDDDDWEDSVSDEDDDDD